MTAVTRCTMKAKRKARRHVLCKTFWIIIFSVFSMNALANQASPLQVAEAVANNIVDMTSFEFVEKPASWSQKNAYVLRFAGLPNKPKQVLLAKTGIVFAPDANENHIDERHHTHLAFSHSAGALEVFINDELVFSSFTEKPQTFMSIDYQLNQFANYLPTRFSENDEILLKFTPSTSERLIYISPVYANSKMAANKIKLSTTLDKKTAPFAIKEEHEDSSWQLQRQPSTYYLQNNLAFSDFRYFTGTFLDAMHQVSNHFDSLNYDKYLANHNAFFFENYLRISETRREKGLISGPFDHADRFLLLDDFGPQMVPFINSLEKDGESTPYFKDKTAMLLRAVSTINERVPRLEDGTLTRLTPFTLTVQSDDLFMGGFFLIRASQYMRDETMLEDAIRQVLNFHRYLIVPETGLYRHAYFAPKDAQSTTSWGRGVGWMAMTYVELLKVLPENHPQYAEILKLYRDFNEAVYQHQNKDDGRWHQVLTDNTSYLETSVTAMFLRSLATGVHKGWLQDEKFRQSAEKAWEGLVSQIDKKGNVTGIVRGTPIFSSAEDYETHMPRKNDPRGLGAVLYAAIAVDKMLNQ